MTFRWLVAALLAAMAAAAMADDRAEYNRRAAERDMAAFKQLDLNGDGRVSREEAEADLNFVPRFADIDINRDGIITPEEIHRYVGQTYGVEAPR